MKHQKFSNDQESMYGNETYWQRFMHFQKLISFTSVFYSESKLRKFSQILSNQEKSHETQTDEQLWEMKYALASNFHPQLNSPIPIFFRINTYILMNAPLALGIILIPPTPLTQIISQGLNQVYNFAFNYCNRNTSNSFNRKELLFSLILAVITAIAVSLGTIEIVKFVIPDS